MDKSLRYEWSNTAVVHNMTFIIFEGLIKNIVSTELQMSDAIQNQIKHD